MAMTYSDVTRMLYDLVAAPSQDALSTPRLLETVSCLAEPSQLVKLLQKAYSDPEIGRECARRSFLHPLGFRKITLINVDSLFTLRIHVWWPTNRPIQPEHVHNHRFGFVSAIVSGAYDMQIFVPDDLGVPMTEYTEQVDSQSGWRLYRAGDARLRTVNTVRLKPGASYALSAQALHKVTAEPTAPCVTLFLQTATFKSKTRVFVEPGHRPPDNTPKQPFDDATYRRQLELLLSELRCSSLSGV